MVFVSISVRELVEFMLREGDIDSTKGSGLNKEAMLLGSRMHRKIQKKMGVGYEAEVPLSYTVYEDDYTLTVEGRADGIFDKENIVYIDEIKGVYKNVEKMERAIPVHEAQAKCYAFMKSELDDLSSVGVQMTYVNLETEKTKYFDQIYTREEITSWFHELVDGYKKWVQFSIDHSKERNASIKDKEFPFPYRKGQRDMAVSVYTAIKREKNLFLQAPTGIGKTMAALYPSVKAIGEGLDEKIFYLTAKTIAASVAIEAFDLLRKQGITISSTVITAKEKICPMEECNCDPNYCPYAKGHYDRINDSLFDLITNCEEANRDTILDYANKHTVCPFELNLDVSLFMDAIICDYNYVFDPRVNLKRYFAESKKSPYIFLVDEAHNLVDRARSMYSASLCKEDLLSMRKLVKTEFPTLYKQLGQCNALMLELKRECETYKLYPEIGRLYLALMRVQASLEFIFDSYKNVPMMPVDRSELLDFYFKINQFLMIYAMLDEGYVIYGEVVDRSFYVHLYCVHTGNPINEVLKKSSSTVFFSATMLPIFYYKDLFGAEADDYAIYIPSPFDKKKRRILIGKDVTTRYQMRGPKQYEQIADYIRKAVHTYKGNYMIFFPSYQMLEEVYSLFDTSDEEITYLKQTNHMKEAEREEFLKTFSNEGRIVAFAIMGGIFSEGIDLTNEKLIGAICVGCGLPMVCNEREILKNYFDQRGGDGFAYAYRYPGMNKVEQAAGRVIRTEEDEGIILLLDERFVKREYVLLFPMEWDDYKVIKKSELEEELLDFAKTIP